MPTICNGANGAYHYGCINVEKVNKKNKINNSATGCAGTKPSVKGSQPQVHKRSHSGGGANIKNSARHIAYQMVIELPKSFRVK